MANRKRANQADRGATDRGAVKSARTEPEGVQLDQLPYLCLKKIFGFLNLRDRIKCRAVSRQFKEYADEAGIEELVVRKKQSECSKQCKTWYLTDRPIERGSAISPKAFDTARAPPFKLSEQLKYLHLHFDSKVDFEFLNGFKLVHLELRGRFSGGPKTLVLPNLKVLDVRTYSSASIVLETPKLEVLACGDISNIQAEHPETIKRIECDCSDANALAKFENLQILVFHCSYDSDLDGIRLSNWTQLKELQFQFQSRSEYEDLRSSLTDLVHQRTESKREELKLYLEEVLLIDTGVDQLNDYRRNRDEYGYYTDDYTDDRPDELFWMKNFRQLRCDSYPDVTKVDFNALMELNPMLSSEFFERFPRIQKLTATGLVDLHRFDWFVHNATALRKVRLTNISLGQTIEERPKFERPLNLLVANEHSARFSNFDLIVRFEKLENFRTNAGLNSLDMVASTFEQLSKLISFEFREGHSFVKITRCSCDRNKYNLEFYCYGYTDKKEQFYEDSLKWPELVMRYDQTKAKLAKQAPKFKSLH